MNVEFSDPSMRLLQGNGIDSRALGEAIKTFLEGINNPHQDNRQGWKYKGRFLDWKAQMSSQKSIYLVVITNIV
jgi:hypothetical protein